MPSVDVENAWSPSVSYYGSTGAHPNQTLDRNWESNVPDSGVCVCVYELLFRFAFAKCNSPRNSA